MGGQPPYGGPQAPPYGAAQPYPAAYGQPPRGFVPPSLDEIYYKPGLNILLYIVTCGIWGAVWSYKTHDDLQKYNGEGLGAIFGLVIGLLAGVVIMFTVPMEIARMYEREGRQSPVHTIDGLWFLLPIAGLFIWYFKTQDALNDFWLSKGSRPAQ